MALLLALLAQGIWAQFRHPLYLHARGDLRRAVLFMRIPDEPNVMRDMQIASGLVERAIREIDMAAVLDRRGLEDNPPIDTRLGRGGRFREILRLLDSARRDLGREEDNPAAAMWRNRAFGFIDQAMAMVRKGGYDRLADQAGPPPPRPGIHPRYLSAISDLRFARALLWRADFRDVMRDQRAAVDAIDRALAEAKRAAIDDGRNPNDHPPIDAGMGWENRFRKTMELLDAAIRDLSFVETNGQAAAWRTAAIENVQSAKAFTARAMRAQYWH